MQKLCTLFIGYNCELLTARHSAHCTEVTTKAVDSHVKLKLYTVTRGLILSGHLKSVDTVVNCSHKLISPYIHTRPCCSSCSPQFKMSINHKLQMVTLTDM